jgi:hypothetical protein
LAGLGDRRGTETALLAAESWFAKRTPENDRVWLRYFDKAELAAEFAHSYRFLRSGPALVVWGTGAGRRAIPIGSKTCG